MGWRRSRRVEVEKRESAESRMTIKGATQLPTLTFERFPLSPFVRTWDHSLAWFRSSRRLQTSGKHIADREGARCSQWFARLQDAKCFFGAETKTMERRCPVPNTKTNLIDSIKLSRATGSGGSLLPRTARRAGSPAPLSHQRTQARAAAPISRHSKKRKKEEWRRDRPTTTTSTPPSTKRPRRGPLCPSPTSLSA